jgi:outer membrane murein-binding lipoprotein Lpp
MIFEQQSQVDNINSTVESLSDKIFNKTNSSIVLWNSRDTLRMLKPENNELIFVESLGVFKFISDSTEKDDDETCFRTSSGAWILEIPHWDFIHANMIFENNSLNDKINDLTSKINDLTARIVTLENSSA